MRSMAPMPIVKSAQYGEMHEVCMSGRNNVFVKQVPQKLIVTGSKHPVCVA